jgi:RNA polymerase sigma factor (sigma-70 family)
VAAAADRQSALEAADLQHRGRLVKVAAGILRDEAEAEDVVQDTLLAVCRVLRRREIASVRNYLYRAVRINALKRRARANPVALGDLAALEPAEPTDAQDEADEPQIDPLDLERAILSLPPAQQSVIRMKYYLDMSFRQIGQALAVSLFTGASRCRYALARMRDFLTRKRKEGKEQP